METREGLFERIGPAPLSERAMPHMVRMRDGVHLATDVYLPAPDCGPGPTMLIRLPYDKTGEYTFIPRIAEYVIARGYRVVAQDVRGKFRSEGEPLMFVCEVNDGADTLDWIEQQEWSDGTVGMWGDSYYGFTQWAAVSTGHRALRAISPRVTGTRLGLMPERTDGSPTMEVEPAVARLYAATYYQDRDIYHWEVDWTTRPYLASVERFFAAVGARSPSWDMLFPRQVPVSRFPAGSPFDARPVPVLMTIGWWDNCAPHQWHDHAELQRRPAWAVNEYLLIDSVDHEWYHLTDGEHDLERNEAELDRVVADSLDPTLEFFDVFLRGCAPADSIPRVRWNLAHTPGLRAAPSWPPPGTRPRALAATATGTLEPSSPTAGCDPAAAPLSWVHDPDDLVPSPASNAFAFLQDSPDERAWSQRDDVLAFDAAPVAADLDLVGPVTLRAIVGGDGPKLDVFARLLDVDPSGEAHLIARGQVHVPELDGELEVAIDLGQIGYRLRAGHALRLHVASSDFPEFMPQPGTGAEPWTAVEVARNRQTLRGGAVLAFSVLEATHRDGAGPDGARSAADTEGGQPRSVAPRQRPGEERVG